MSTQTLNPRVLGKPINRVDGRLKVTGEQNRCGISAAQDPPCLCTEERHFQRPHRLAELPLRKPRPEFAPCSPIKTRLKLDTKPDQERAVGIQNE